MVARILVCENCGSEKLENCMCEGCHGLSDEEWAVKEAKADYVADRIGISELEKRIEQAFINPPKRDHYHIVYR